MGHVYVRDRRAGSLDISSKVLEATLEFEDKILSKSTRSEPEGRMKKEAAVVNSACERSPAAD